MKGLCAPVRALLSVDLLPDGDQAAVVACHKALGGGHEGLDRLAALCRQHPPELPSLDHQELPRVGPDHQPLLVPGTLGHPGLAGVVLRVPLGEGVWEELQVGVGRLEDLEDPLPDHADEAEVRRIEAALNKTTAETINQKLYSLTAAAAGGARGNARERSPQASGGQQQTLPGARGCW